MFICEQVYFNNYHMILYFLLYYKYVSKYFDKYCLNMAVFPQEWSTSLLHGVCDVKDLFSFSSFYKNLILIYEREKRSKILWSSVRPIKSYLHSTQRTSLGNPDTWYI